jgi:predicted RNA-binding Zn-ribbon protein involved in translation (DUF1610 family)
MYIDLTRGKMVTCSKCGSTNAVHPVNQPGVAVRCGDCGHTKLTREAEAKAREREQRSKGFDLSGWSDKDDADPTF